MNEIVFKDTSRVLIETLRVELQNQAESFVKVGYLLKAARDTDVLKDTSYSSVQDMAATEYGLTPDMVSRYIRIYERFGEGEGRLMSNYQGYGVAKLQIMITLPDEINDQLTPEMTKNQITEVANEVHEEQKISDMEVMCEEPGNKNLDVLQQFFMAFFEEHRQTFLMISPLPFPSESDYEEFKETFFPTGTNMIFARVPQQGKVMMAEDGSLTNIRTGERQEYTWKQIYEEMDEMSVKLEFSFDEEGYKKLFGEEDKSEPKVEEPKKETKKPEKVSEKTSKPAVKEEPEEEIKDEDVPGQTKLTEQGIEVPPESIPEKVEAEIVDERYEKILNLSAVLTRQLRAAHNSGSQIDWIDAKMTTESILRFCKDMEAKTARGREI